MKNGLFELEEAIGIIADCLYSWENLEIKRQRMRQEEPSTQSIAVLSGSKKRAASSLVEKSGGKRRERERENCLTSGLRLSLDRRKGARRPMTGGCAANINNLSEECKERDEEKEVSETLKPRAEVFITRPAGGRFYVEVLEELRKNVRLEIRSIRKTKTGGILVELGANTTRWHSKTQ